VLAQVEDERPGVEAPADRHAVRGGALEHAAGCPPVRRHRVEVGDDQPARPDAGRLLVVVVGADVADVRGGQDQDLAVVRRVREHLLVAGHRGVEDHLAVGGERRAGREPVEDRAVGQREPRAARPGQHRVDKLLVH